MRAQFRADFDPAQSFVVRRPVRLSGVHLEPGAPFPTHTVSVRRLRQLFDSRIIAYPGEDGRDLTKPPAPKRFGKWASPGGKANERVQPHPDIPDIAKAREPAHMPTSITQRATIAALGKDTRIPDEFDDGDLEPVLNRNPPPPGPTLQEMLAAEPLAPRAAPPADPNRPGALVQIPADWAELKWPKLLSLASNFSLVRIMNKAEATDSIEAELKRRGRTA